MSTQTNSLKLKNGLEFKGKTFEWTQTTSGEVVFNTGLTGYVETLTDPSYCDQILVFTYPLIGNYGIPEADKWESKQIYANGVIINNVHTQTTHHEAKQDFVSWLKEQDVPVMYDVDTRALTKTIRDEGVMPGVIKSHSHTTSNIDSLTDINEQHLVEKVSAENSKVVYKSDSEAPTIIVMDCGMKQSILKNLKQYEWNIKILPHDEKPDFNQIDGLFVSNGPGDPTKCTETIQILQEAMKKDIPLFGICLGAQVLALAGGAETYKLTYGHRSHNQPCKHTKTGNCYITSQNHGFCIHKESLPSKWEITFNNLNDDTVEGIEHADKPFFAVQFHPEASPGPTDTTWLFDKFHQSVIDNI